MCIFWIVGIIWYYDLWCLKLVSVKIDKYDNYGCGW